jgi:flagellin-like hook-associated protein FlgL
MTRVATYGSNQLYVSRIMDIQKRLENEQLQVSTELRSQVYSGIAPNSNRLLNLQNMKSQAQQFKEDNAVADTKLSAATVAVNSVADTIKQFRSRLTTFASGNTKDQKNVEQMQNWAYRAMVDMTAYLGTSVNGEYLFSGGRTTTEPVQLPTNSLGDFQQLFDGNINEVPTTRAASLVDVHLTNTDTGALTFVAGSGIVKAANAASLKDIPAGSLIDVGNTAGNDGKATVMSHAATNNAGAALQEGTATTTAFITYGSGTNLLNAATGNLKFAFAADGSMTVTPTTANALQALAVGTKFTINDTPTGSYDGNYVVTANTAGVVTLKNDTDVAKTETIDTAGLTMKFDSPVTDGVPDSSAGVTLGSGNAVFSTTGSTVTLTLPAGTSLPAGFAANKPFTMSGTANHNGTYTIATIASGAGGTTITFNANPDALRLSKFVPQTGRTDVKITPTDNSSNFTATDYGSLSFSPTGTGGETITAATANAFMVAGVIQPPTGAIINLKSTTGVNDGVYKIVSNDGTHIVVEGRPVTGETDGAATIDTNSWYKGDTLTLQHRVDAGRAIDFGVYASDPAFEKALRAMYVIAQGKFGTAGGLENNQSRVNAALYLTNDALQSPASGTAPYGAEERSDINSVQANIGVAQQTIKLTDDKHTQFIGFLDQRIIDIAHVDKTEAVTLLLNDSNALQASYQALAQVRNLSLLTYLK